MCILKLRNDLSTTLWEIGIAVSKGHVAMSKGHVAMSKGHTRDCLTSNIKCMCSKHGHDIPHSYKTKGMAKPLMN